MIWFAPVTICASAIITMVLATNILPAPNLSKSQKIYKLRVALCIMLFFIIVQFLIDFYLIQYEPGSNGYLLTIINCLEFAIGVISPYLALKIAAPARCLFHPYDILDSWFLIIWIIGTYAYSKVPVLYYYIPLYFYIIKAILIVFLNPSGIMDLSVTEREDVVVFRTWTGNFYRGKPSGFCYCFVIAFSDFEKRIAPNTWKSSMMDWQMYVSIFFIVEILYLYVPFYFSTIKAILMVFLDPSGIMDVTVTEQKDFVVFRTWSGKIYRGKPYDVSGSFAVELRDVTERIAPNTWKKARNGFRFQLSIIWMKKVPRKIEEIEC
ncbi:unnamed protein product [Caenorhabditis nigoni]